MSGRPFLIGSGMTPGAPDTGWPPPSYISEMLIARRAVWGQNEILSVMIASFPIPTPLRVIAAPDPPAAARNGQGFTVARCESEAIVERMAVAITRRAGRELRVTSWPS